MRGDIRSQLAACDIGERALLELISRYGASEISRYSDALLEYSERRARQEISALPDGKFEFTDHIDADKYPSFTSPDDRASISGPRVGDRTGLR